MRPALPTDRGKGGKRQSPPPRNKLKKKEAPSSPRGGMIRPGSFSRGLSLTNLLKSAATEQQASKEAAGAQLGVEAAIKDAIARLHLNALLFFNMCNTNKNRSYVSAKEIKAALCQLTKRDVPDAVMVTVMARLDPNLEGAVDVKAMRRNFNQLSSLSSTAGSSPSSKNKQITKKKAPPPRKNAAKSLFGAGSAAGGVVEISLLDGIGDDHGGTDLTPTVQVGPGGVLAIGPEKKSAEELLQEASSSNMVQEREAMLADLAKGELVLGVDGVRAMLSSMPQLAFEWEDAMASSANPSVGSVKDFTRKMNGWLFAHLDANGDGVVGAEDVAVWRRMLPLGRGREALVEAVMAADVSGRGRVSERDLYFLLRTDLLLAAELDAQCRVLQFILDPPEQVEAAPRLTKNPSFLSGVGWNNENDDDDDDDDDGSKEGRKQMIEFLREDSGNIEFESLMANRTSADGDSDDSDEEGERDLARDARASLAFAADLMTMTKDMQQNAGNDLMPRSTGSEQRNKVSGEMEMLVFRSVAKILLSRVEASHSSAMAHEHGVALEVFTALDKNRTGVIDFFDIQCLLRTECRVLCTEEDLHVLCTYRPPNIRSMHSQELALITVRPDYDGASVSKTASAAAAAAATAAASAALLTPSSSHRRRSSVLARTASHHLLLPGEVDCDSDEEGEELNTNSDDDDSKKKKHKLSTQLDANEFRNFLNLPSNKSLKRLLHRVALDVHKRKRGEDEGQPWGDAASVSAADMLRAAREGPVGAGGTGGGQQKRRGSHRERRGSAASVEDLSEAPPPEGFEPFSQRDLLAFFRFLDTDQDGFVGARDLSLWLRCVAGHGETHISRRDVLALFHPHQPRFTLRKKKAKKLDGGRPTWATQASANLSSLNSSFFDLAAAMGDESSSPPGLKKKPTSPPPETELARMNGGQDFKLGGADDDSEWDIDALDDEEAQRRAFQLQRNEGGEGGGAGSKPLTGGKPTGEGEEGGGRLGVDEDEYEAEVPDRVDGFKQSLRKHMNGDGCLSEVGLRLALQRRPYLASQLLQVCRCFAKELEAEDLSVLDHFEPQVAAAVEALQVGLQEADENGARQGQTQEAVGLGSLGYLTDAEYGIVRRHRKACLHYAALAAQRHLKVQLHLESGIVMHFLAQREETLFPQKVAEARSLGAFRPPKETAALKLQKRLSALADAPPAAVLHPSGELSGVSSSLMTTGKLPTRSVSAGEKTLKSGGSTVHRVLQGNVDQEEEEEVKSDNEDDASLLPPRAFALSGGATSEKPSSMSQLWAMASEGDKEGGGVEDVANEEVKGAKERPLPLIIKRLEDQRNFQQAKLSASYAQSMSPIRSSDSSSADMATRELMRSVSCALAGDEEEEDGRTSSVDMQDNLHASSSDDDNEQPGSPLLAMKRQESVASENVLGVLVAGGDDDSDDAGDYEEPRSPSLAMKRQESVASENMLDMLVAGGGDAGDDASASLELIKQAESRQPKARPKPVTGRGKGRQGGKGDESGKGGADKAERIAKAKARAEAARARAAEAFAAKEKLASVAPPATAENTVPLNLPSIPPSVPQPPPLPSAEDGPATRNRPAPGRVDGKGAKGRGSAAPPAAVSFAEASGSSGDSTSSLGSDSGEGNGGGGRGRGGKGKSRGGPAGAKRGASPVRPGASPVRPRASPVRPGASPVRPGASPVRPGASPARPGASPVRAKKNPPARSLSPQRGLSQSAVRDDARPNAAAEPAD